jgi:hypothetical protein
MEQRHRAYEEATQARREHMIKMHEYRAAVLKRIEQDRQDMYKRRHETMQQKQRKRDAQMDRIEQIEKHSMNRPIQPAFLTRWTSPHLIFESTKQVK